MRPPFQAADSCCRPNGTVAKLRAAPHASSDAARPLPRLTIALAEVICNGRDAVANESAEALHRRTKISAVRQLQLVVGRLSPWIRRSDRIFKRSRKHVIG